MPVNYGFIPQSTQVSAQIQNAATNTGRQMAEQKMQLGQLWGNAFQQAGDAFGNAILQPAMLKYQQRMQDAQRTAEQNWWKDQFALRTAGKTWDEWQPELEKAGGLQQWQLANEIDAQSMLQNAELANRELSQIRMFRTQQMLNGQVGGMQQRGSAGAGALESDYSKLYELATPQQREQIDKLTTGMDDIAFGGPLYAALDPQQQNQQWSQMGRQRDAIYQDVMRKNPTAKATPEEIFKKSTYQPPPGTYVFQGKNGLDSITVKPNEIEQPNPLSQMARHIFALPQHLQKDALNNLNGLLTRTDENGTTYGLRFDSNGIPYADKLADPPKSDSEKLLSDWKPSFNQLTPAEQISITNDMPKTAAIPESEGGGQRDYSWDERAAMAEKWYNSRIPRSSGDPAPTVETNLFSKYGMPTPQVDMKQEDLDSARSVLRTLPERIRKTPRLYGLDANEQLSDKEAMDAAKAVLQNPNRVQDEGIRANLLWALRVFEATHAQ